MNLGLRDDIFLWFPRKFLWKTIKIVLEHNKIDTSGGPKHCIKQAVRYSFINDDEIILDMLDDRKIESHTIDGYKSQTDAIL